MIRRKSLRLNPEVLLADESRQIDGAKNISSEKQNRPEEWWVRGYPPSNARDIPALAGMDEQVPQGVLGVSAS